MGGIGFPAIWRNDCLLVLQARILTSLSSLHIFASSLLFSSTLQQASKRHWLGVYECACVLSRTGEFRRRVIYGEKNGHPRSVTSVENGLFERMLTHAHAIVTRPSFNEGLGTRLTCKAPVTK